MIRRLQKKLQQVPGIRLYMQPVQDLSMNDRVSRTQYQYALDDPNMDELNEWADKFVQAQETSRSGRCGHGPAGGRTCHSGEY